MTAHFHIHPGWEGVQYSLVQSTSTAPTQDQQFEIVQVHKEEPGYTPVLVILHDIMS